MSLIKPQADKLHEKLQEKYGSTEPLPLKDAKTRETTWQFFASNFQVFTDVDEDDFSVNYENDIYHPVMGLKGWHDMFYVIYYSPTSNKCAVHVYNMMEPSEKWVGQVAPNLGIYSGLEACMDGIAEKHWEKWQENWQKST